MNQAYKIYKESQFTSRSKNEINSNQKLNSYMSDNDYEILNSNNEQKYDQNDLII